MSNVGTKAAVMAHMVACYPNYNASVEVAHALADAGAGFLEIQFPFSDPTADGPVIQAACTKALSSGFTVDEGFRLVREIAEKIDVPLFIMTYASIVYARGVKEFVQAAKEAGARGLIVPDLPPDYDEGLYGHGKQAGIAVVPVLVPTAREERIETVLSAKPEYLYAALRSGITGTKTTLGPENLDFLDRLRESGARVMGGFGIQTREQVAELSPHVDTVIIGSTFVRAIGKALAGGQGGTLYDALYAVARDLIGQGD